MTASPPLNYHAAMALLIKGRGISQSSDDANHLRDQAEH